MSDPAVEAAQRAWKAQYDLDTPPWPTAIVAAREALKPIREVYELWGHPESAEAYAIMQELAPLIYTTEELSDE